MKYDAADENIKFNVNEEQKLFEEMVACWDLCFEYNNIKPSMMKERFLLMKKILGKTTDNFLINSPFHCSRGSTIEIGENACFNNNCIIMDFAAVTFGDYVWVGPNCGFYTSGHSVDPLERSQGVGYAHPITVGNNVWFGGNVVVATTEKKGITIGDNAVIAAGSVVVSDIPANALAAGNPAKVIRTL